MNISRALLASAVAVALSGCGGGSSDPATTTTPTGTNTPASTSPTPTSAPVSPSPSPATTTTTPTGTTTSPSAPAPTSPNGLTASQQAGLDRLNYQRSLAGVPAVTVLSSLMASSGSHANYVSSTDENGHYESTTTNPYFTGYDPVTRMKKAGYNQNLYAEVVARTTDSSVADQVDLLIMAIYHRFPMISGSLDSTGVGVANKPGVADLTMDMGAQKVNLATALTLYPADQQTGVAVAFNPNTESPNPAPGYTVVGYPISLQTGWQSTVVPKTFTVTAVGGNGTPITSKILQSSTDAETPAWATALVPLTPLTYDTTYQVNFTGTVDGLSVARTWQFRTKPYVAPTLTFTPNPVVAGQVTSGTLSNMDTQTDTSYYVCYSSSALVSSIQFVTYSRFDVQTRAGGCTASSCPLAISVTRDQACSNIIAQSTVTVTP